MEPHSENMGQSRGQWGEDGRDEAVIPINDQPGLVGHTQLALNLVPVTAGLSPILTLCRVYAIITTINHQGSLKI